MHITCDGSQLRAPGQIRPKALFINGGQQIRVAEDIDICFAAPHGHIIDKLLFRRHKRIRPEYQLNIRPVPQEADVIGAAPVIPPQHQTHLFPRRSLRADSHIIIHADGGHPAANGHQLAHIPAEDIGGQLGIPLSIAAVDPSLPGQQYPVSPRVPGKGIGPEIQRLQFLRFPIAQRDQAKHMAQPVPIPQAGHGQYLAILIG